VHINWPRLIGGQPLVGEREQSGKMHRLRKGGGRMDYLNAILEMEGGKEKCVLIWYGGYEIG